MEKVKNIEPGMKFYRWTVIRRAEQMAGTQACWICRCDCGAVKLIRGTDLKHGKTKSCGCLRHELAVQRKNTLEGKMQAARMRAAKKRKEKAEDVKKRAVTSQLKPYVPEDISQFGYDEWMFK